MDTDYPGGPFFGPEKSYPSTNSDPYTVHKPCMPVVPVKGPKPLPKTKPSPSTSMFAGRVLKSILKPKPSLPKQQSEKMPTKNAIIQKLLVEDLAKRVDPYTIVPEETEAFVLSSIDCFLDKVIMGAACITKNSGRKTISEEDLWKSLIQYYPEMFINYNFQASRITNNKPNSPRYLKRSALVRQAQSKHMI